MDYSFSCFIETLRIGFKLSLKVQDSWAYFLKACIPQPVADFTDSPKPLPVSSFSLAQIIPVPRHLLCILGKSSLDEVSCAKMKTTDNNPIYALLYPLSIST